MSLMQTFKQLAQTLKSEFQVYRLLRHHPQTPTLARWLLASAIAYILMPFDLIPDFIPVIGQLDELVIVPGLVYLALKMVPASVLQECRLQQAGMLKQQMATQQTTRQQQDEKANNDKDNHQ